MNAMTNMPLSTPSTVKRYMQIEFTYIQVQHPDRLFSSSRGDPITAMFTASLTELGSLAVDIRDIVWISNVIALARGH